MANPENLIGKGFESRPENINRKGRPKQLPKLDILLAEVLGDEKNGITAAETILQRLRQQAIKGNLRAAEILLDRGYGKPKITQEVDVKGSGAFVTKIIVSSDKDGSDA